MLKKKLFAFSKPINHFLDKCFDTPVNVYGKDLDLCMLAANQCQLSASNVTKLQDILGASMYDLASNGNEAKSIICNDKSVMNKSGSCFFVENTVVPESRLVKTYFSAKTALRDSGNQVVGCFGLSCCVEDASFIQLAAILNDLNLDHGLDAFSMSAPLVLKKSFSLLTEREQDCVYCLIRSMTCKEIARELNISPRTVESHIEHIKNKLGCYSRSDIIDRVFEVRKGT